MAVCLIISGGEYSPIPENLHFDYIIAVDRGVEYARSEGITPDFIMGDFDSCDLHGPTMQFFSNIPIHISPTRKDDTDTMLAVKFALSHGYDRIVICCGLGLRMDHTLANIQSMHYVAAHGGVCEMVSEREYLRTITPADGAVSIPAKKNTALSLLALSDEVEGVSIYGTDYDGTPDFVNSFPLGHGNHILSYRALVSIQKGVLLVTCSREE